MVRYIIRLDDACPTIHKENWKKVFTILDRYNIKPIVAVIPCNEDRSLEVDKFDKNFWKEVKIWQSKGYIIAMHGYNHIYTSNQSGIIPINKRSEFAGHALDVQRDKIRRSLKIFLSNDITPTVWVAPAHSFDENTLIALKGESKIRIISDGISKFPFTKNGFFWIPVQIWKFKEKRTGVWTICLHPNSITEDKLNALEQGIKLNTDKFIYKIDELVELFANRKRNIKDNLFSFIFYSKIRIKQKFL